MSQTQSPTYDRLTPQAKSVLGDLEDTRRLCAADPDPVIKSNAKLQVFAADYVIRAVTGDVLADDDVKLIMDHAFGEVGS